LWIVEMLRSMSAEGMLDLSNATATLTRPELPDSLREVIVRRVSYRSVSGRPKPARCWLRPSIATKRSGLDRSLPEPEPAFESLVGDGGAAGAGAERCPAGRA